MGIPGSSSSSNNNRSDSDDWVPSIWEAVRHAIKPPTGQQGAILEGCSSSRESLAAEHHSQVGVLATPEHLGHCATVLVDGLGAKRHDSAHRDQLLQPLAGGGSRGAWAVSGASMQAMRIVSRLPASFTRILSSSPTDTTAAAAAGPASNRCRAMWGARAEHYGF